jgi:geranylgeranyl diphosphate synthase type I
MDIYGETLKFLLSLRRVDEWSELQELLKQAVARRPRDWQLPVLACEAVGGMPERSLPAVAAIACLQISIILIDDMLDEDPRGEYRRRGMPAVTNLAAAFQAAGLEAVATSTYQDYILEPEVRLAVFHRLNHMVLATALGQHWDTQNPADENSYWRMVHTKSGPFYGAALYVGALYGGASIHLAEQLRRWGQCYGEMIQIHDDLNDSLATPASQDWKLGRASLPILFAQEVQHPKRERFLDLRQVISDPDALAEAQEILLRCGAISYGVYQLLRRYKTAQATLTTLPLVQRSQLEDLLKSQVQPIRALFQAIGVEAAPPGLPDESPVMMG